MCVDIVNVPRTLPKKNVGCGHGTPSLAQYVYRHLTYTYTNISVLTARNKKTIIFVAFGYAVRCGQQLNNNNNK